MEEAIYQQLAQGAAKSLEFFLESYVVTISFE